MMWRLFIILICIIVNPFAQNQFKAKDPYSIVIKFDLIVDEDINESDPRIKSIIYSAKSYRQSKIIINYTNPNANSLATHLAQIFVQQKLLVVKPRQIQSSGFDDNRYVQVTIYYQE